MKVLVHAIDGIGLGHVARTLALATELEVRAPGVRIVFVTNAIFTDPIAQAGFKIYPLPVNTKMVVDGRLSYPAYLRMNFTALRRIITKEAPDLVLMDSEFNALLVDWCVKKRIKTCFILRSSTDARVQDLCAAGDLARVDLVLVPHLMGDLGRAQRDLLSQQYNVVFTGPLIRQISYSLEKKCEGVIKVLITFSAGADITGNQVLFSKVSAFLEKCKRQNNTIQGQKLQITIVTGPYFKKSSCNLHGYKSRMFEQNLAGLLACSDIVIAPCGYNLVNEIVAVKTPSLLIPIKTQEDKQEERARHLVKAGCAAIVDEDIWSSLEGLMRTNALGIMGQCFPAMKPGNAMAADRLLTLMQKKPKVLVLRADWLPVSERFIRDEVCALQAYDPVILCLRQNNPGAGSFPVLYEAPFVPLWHAGYPQVRTEHAGLFSRFMDWAEAQVRLMGVTILHAEFLTDAQFFLELQHRLGLPFVVSVRGYDLYAQKLTDEVILAVDMFLVRSHLMKQDLLAKGVVAQKIMLQHSGIRLPAKAPVTAVSSVGVRMVLVGRLVEKKGTVFGIQVFNALRRLGLNLQLIIVGDGPLKAKVLEAICQSSYAQQITFVGEQPNDKVLQIMRHAHILLQPSLTAKDGDREGIPGAVMEAMALGLIVVASRSGSISEIVDQDKTGLLFDEADLSGAVKQCVRAFQIVKGRKGSVKGALVTNARAMISREFNVLAETRKLEAVYTFVEREKRHRKFERYYQNYQSSAKNGQPAFFRVDIHPVRGCNSFCLMCDNWKQGKKEFLSLRKLLEAMKAFRSIGVKELRFHGQEPTLRQDLPSLIAVAKKLGFTVGLKTNAVGLTEDYCQSLLPLDKLYLSIDSPDERLHNKMRGKAGSFEDNIRVIGWMKALKASILVEANTVVTRLNYKSLSDMPRLAAEQGLAKVSFVLPNTKNKKDIATLLLKRPAMEEFFFQIIPKILEECVNRDVAFDCSPFFAELVLAHPLVMINELKLRPDQFREEIDNFLARDYGKTFFQRYGCYAPLDHASVNFDGNMYPCCVVERQDAFAVGNISQHSAQEVWDSPRYDNLRKQTVKSQGRCCEQGVGCASNFSVRKFLAERIQAGQKTDESLARSYLEQMLAFFILPRDEIQRHTDSRRKEVLQLALAQCDFYKDKTLATLFLTKEDIKNNLYAGLINRSYMNHADLILDRTSGTMSEAVPFAYLKGFQRYVRMIVPFVLNLRWAWGERYCVFTTLHCSREKCSSDDLPHYVQRIKVPASDNIFSDTQSLQKACQILKEQQPSVVHADPFYLCAVAMHLQSLKMKIALKGVSSTYEILTPAIKRFLATSFDCCVVDSYGCSELGSVAFTCEKGQMHVFENTVHVEIVDKGRYADLEVGEMVLTALDNPAMPLIRYRTGDLGKIVQKPCGCHRNVMILEVHGRCASSLSLQGGKVSERDIAVLMDIPGVLLYQIVQHTDEELSCVVLLWEGNRDVRTQAHLRRMIKGRFTRHYKISIGVTFVAEMRPDAAGKFKTLVSL